MKKWILLVLLISCKNHESEVKNNIITCDLELTAKIETKIINDLNVNLTNKNYQLVLTKIKSFWLENNVLISNDKEGYSSLLNQVKRQGFSDELVHGLNIIYKENKNFIYLRGLIVTIDKHDNSFKKLSEKCSLKGIYNLANRLKKSSNITSVEISKNLIECISPEDLNKPFYQDFIILFYLTLI